MNTYDPAHGMVYRHMSRETDTCAVPGDRQERYRPAALPRQRQLAADPPDGPAAARVGSGSPESR